MICEYDACISSLTLSGSSVAPPPPLSLDDAEVQQLQEATHDFFPIRRREKEDLELPSEPEEQRDSIRSRKRPRKRRRRLPRESEKKRPDAWSDQYLEGRPPPKTVPNPPKEEMVRQRPDLAFTKSDGEKTKQQICRKAKCHASGWR